MLEFLNNRIRLQANQAWLGPVFFWLAMPRVR